MPEAIVEKRKGISPVWILPILAICLGGWLLYKSHRDAGIDIIIHTDSAAGITANKTPVLFRGNHVGMVKEIHVSKDLKGVDMAVEVVKDAEPYLVEDLKFWIEKVDIEAGRITGLETLFSGSYIGFQLGESKKSSRSFVALSHRPPTPMDAPGLHITLQSDALYSVQVGSGIYHKNMSIGTVQSFDLKPDDTVSIEVFVNPKYAGLVKEDSRFWNASGISVSGGITDLKVHIASLAAIIKGGIMMETPPSLKDSPAAQNGRVFKMFEDFNTAKYGLPITLELLSGEGIHEGATKIMYRGMELGHVSKLKINKNEKHTVSATVLIDPRAKSILNSGTTFYLVKPEFSLEGVKNIDTLISGSYITFVPGAKGEPKDHFVVKNQNPPGNYALEHADGLTIQLKSSDLGSLSAGSPILYKKVRVGEITGVALREKEDDVLLIGVISKLYAGLVQTSSKFYNLSGIEVTASLSGVKVHTGSLETIIAGGISFFTPYKAKAANKDTVYQVYSDFDAAKNSDRTKIVIHFEKIDGLKKGAKIKYNGITIGEVTDISYEEQMTKIRAVARLDKEADVLLKSDTTFWLVRPEFSLTGTQHLDTILSGPYIALAPGTEKSAREFTAVKEEPLKTKAQTGLKIVLEADDLFSVKPGSAIYYRRLKVGEVVRTHLAPDFQKILIDVVIEQQYAPIVRENSKFWNASGIHVTGGVLSGLSVSTESLEALMAGGVAFATPNNDKMGAAVTNGFRFPMYGEYEDEWLKWSPSLAPVEDTEPVEK